MIDPLTVEKLARLQCTTEEIASFVGCSVRTIERRHMTALQKGRECGKTSLRRAQFKSALKGNATMQIWLGKQWLGQREPESGTANQPSPDALEVARTVRDAVRDAVRQMRTADAL